MKQIIPDNEQRLKHFNRVLSAIRRVDQLIIHPKDRSALLQGACNCLTETQGYFNAWMALFDSDQKLSEGFESGLGEDFQPMAERLRTGDLTRCASNALESEGVIANINPVASCTDCPLSSYYHGRGAMTVRIAHRDRVYGLLSVSVPTAFLEVKEEEEILFELAEDLGYALFSFETEKDLHFHRQITKALPHPMAILDTEYRYQTVNEAYTTIYGRNIDQIAGRSVCDFFPTEFFEKTIRPNLDRCLTGEDVLYEVLIETEHAGPRWMEMRYSPYRGIDGAITGVISSGTDITKRKEQEHESSAILETTHDGFWIVSPEGRILEVNNAAAKMLGYTRDELLKLHIEDIDMEESADETRSHIQKVKAMGHARFDTRHRRKDGRIIDVDVSTTFLPYRGGVLFSFIRDITDKKKAEEALRASEARYRGLSENSPAVIYQFHMTPEGTYSIPYMTENVMETLGVSAEDVNRDVSTLLNLIPENQREAFQDAVKKSARNLSPYKQELQVLRNGEIVWLDAQSTPRREPDGSVLWDGFLTDITRRKQAENEMLRTLLAISEGIWKWNFKTDILEFSQRYYEMLGYKPGEFPATFENWIDLIHPDDQQNALRTAKAYLKTKPDVYENVFRMKNKSGEYLWIRAKGRVVERDASGDAVRMIGNHMDITEIKRAEKSLQKVKERLSSLWNIAKIADRDMKSISDHVLAEVQRITESQYAFYGFITDNEETMTLHAWSKEAMADCRIDDKPLHFPIQEAGIWANAVREKRTVILNDFQAEQSGPKGVPAGHVLLSRLMVVPVVSQDRLVAIAAVANKKEDYTVEDKNQLKAFLTSVQILVDRKNAYEEKLALMRQFQKVQKMESIGNLAGGIAHDFNNILFPIIGLSELLMEDLPANSFEHDSAQRILEAAERGSDLVHQILAFSRETEDEMLPIRLQPILKDVLRLTRSAIPANIEIKQDIQRNVGIVLGDSTQIYQIGMNLITNAYHAVQDAGGKISVQLKEIRLDSEDVPIASLKPGRYAMMVVEDTGTGIEPTHLEKIFDPYFTTKERDKGTGLGLAVAQGIILKHGGDIRVYSELGKGSVFHVYLPLIEKPDKTEPLKETEDLPTGHERILLVDDEKAIIHLEQQILKRLGYAATPFQRPKEALKAFEETPDDFDLVITDMAMPNMTGVELVHELFKIRQDIPVIICTGFNDRIQDQGIKKLGVMGVLEKPMSKSQIARMVRSVLDEKNDKNETT